MSELFGLSMNLIMAIMVAAFAVCALVFAWIFFSNRMMFRMGIRNIGRRRAQSSLVISGLMLATVIITAAFTTGDVIDYSATKVTYDNLQRTDLGLHHFRSGDAAGGETYVPERVTDGLEAAFAADTDIEGFMPFLYEPVPMLNRETNLSEPRVILAGFDPERLARFGGLTLASGRPADLAGLAEDEVLLGKEVADNLDAAPGDVVSIFVDGREHELVVAGIVRDERASGTLEFGPVDNPGGAAAHLTTVQRITGHAGDINSINVALRGGVRGSLNRSAAAADRLEAFEQDDAAKNAAGLAGVAFQVETVKSDAVEDSKLTASLFTTLFLMLGLFSIAAGAMLIFTLFVMLAAERRPEMGIARAVGAQRVHLLQSFVAEGAVYDVIAGLVGVALGVVLALVIVVGGAKLLVGGELSMITAHVAPRSLIVSFCLGSVLTFVTVIFSSVRISQLSVVDAVRGQAPSRQSHQPRDAVSWGWIAAGLVTVAVPLLGLYWLLRKGLGMPMSWVVGTTALVSGLFVGALGAMTQVAFPFTLGVSLVILGSAALADFYTGKSRLVWSLAGLALTLYWLFPNADLGDRIFGTFEESGMEMFVLSGIMAVAGISTVVVFNARPITRLFSARGKGTVPYRPAMALGTGAAALWAIAAFLDDTAGNAGQLGYLAAGILLLVACSSLAAALAPRLAPAFKMGVAYPIANRFRTGMTIAMFSIVVFSITVMSIMNSSFLSMYQSDEGRGGWDLLVASNRNNPITDLRAELEQAGVGIANLEAVGRETVFDDNEQETRVPGGDWEPYPIIAGDAAFFENAEMKLDGRASGYESDGDVYRAVASNEGLAIIDAMPISASAWDATTLRVDATISGGRFEPFQLEVRDAVTGTSMRVTVIGILSAKIPAGLLTGIHVNETTYRRVLGDPEFDVAFVRTAAGTDDSAMAKEIESALVTKGVQAVSIEEEIDEAMAGAVGFLRIFQAFMGLGLFVGIAALGVVALRSVVERRQQIGMLRAIGYQRGTVALTFLLESGFIALTGIVTGLLGAAILSWSLVNGNEFTGATDIPFVIPWVDLVVVVVLAFGSALLMTWWPSRRAASVPVATALRYE